MLKSIRVATLLASFFVAGTALSAEETFSLNGISNPDEALQKIEGYLSFHPKDPKALFSKGVVLTNSGKLDEAEVIFTELTRDHPEIPEPFNNLAVVQATKGDTAKACSTLEKALSIHPNYALAQENLGDCHSKLANKAYAKAKDLPGVAKSVDAKLNVTSALVNDKLPGSAATPITTVKIDGVNEVSTSITNWANAWSDKHVEDYLSHYSADFKPENGLSLSAWKDLRTQRINTPARIKVTLSAVKISVNGDSATASFIQSYESTQLKDRVRKVLTLVKQNGQWLIISEKI